MLNLPPSVRIFICTVPADMRRSFDGLAMMEEYYIHRDPLSGHLFVFRNKNGDKAKILYWDRYGLAIWYKRLEKKQKDVLQKNGMRSARKNHCHSYSCFING